MITTEQIKELRDTTGISVMQCKKALEEAGGDIKKALVILQKKSGEISAKKGDRTFRAGTVTAYVHSTGNVATMVELLCETDFVSGNEEFKTLARDIAMHITASNPKFLKKEDMTEPCLDDMVLMNQPFIKNPELTIEALIQKAVQKFGEKIAVARFKRFKVLES